MLEHNACHNFINHLYAHPFFIGKSLTLILSSEYLGLDIQRSLKHVKPELAIHQLSIENSDYQHIRKHVEEDDISILFLNHISSIKSIEKNKILAKKINPLINSYSNKIIGFTDINNMFNDIFRIPPERIKYLNQTLIQDCKNSKTMNITSTKGTNLSISMKTCKKWASIQGFGDSDDHTPSEVATYTKNISGEFYFRGMFLCQIPFSLKHGFINDPIKITIKKGRITALKCTNKELKKDLHEYLFAHDDHRNIREIGLGTNEGLSYLPNVSASFIERHPGLHLGLGGSIAGSIHMDLISCDSIIHLDKKMIFNDKFFI
jgi:aminopeptidase